jgi:hypothetical protein
MQPAKLQVKSICIAENLRAKGGARWNDIEVGEVRERRVNRKARYHLTFRSINSEVCSSLPSVFSSVTYYFWFF